MKNLIVGLIFFLAFYLVSCGEKDTDVYDMNTNVVVNNVALNYPAVGVELKTEGRWIDGSPIYVQTFETGQLNQEPSSPQDDGMGWSGNTLLGSIPDIGLMIDSKVVMTARNVFNVHSLGSSNFQVGVVQDNNNIFLRGSGSFGAFLTTSAIVTVFYTKK